MRLALAVGTIVVTLGVTAAAHPVIRDDLLSIAMREGYTDPQARAHACRHSRVAYWLYTSLAAFEKHRLALAKIRLLEIRHARRTDKETIKRLDDEAHNIESLAKLYEDTLPILTSVATRNGCQPWPEG